MKNTLFTLLLINVTVFAQKINRDPSSKDIANVFYKTKYTLFDFLTDKPIFPDTKGVYTIYYASNEESIPKKFTGLANELSSLYYYKFSNYINCKNWCEKQKAELNSLKKVYPRNYENMTTTISSHKFCYDDTYGYSGIKFEITLYSDGNAKLDYKSNDIIKRSGKAKWREKSGIAEGFGENTVIDLLLTSGVTLKFLAIKNSWGKTYMLLDSKDNQYMECF